MSLGESRGPNKDSLSLCQRIHELGPEYRFKFTPVGTSLLAHQGDKRGATLPHKPRTPCQLLHVHTCMNTGQSCPGVTQAVSYDPREIHLTRRWSRFSGSIRVLALPFSTQIPDRAVPHTFVQPTDCLMSNPYPGDTNWIPRTSGWREGVTAPHLTRLVPLPGCLLGSEPATCPRTPPAGRKFTSAATSATGRQIFGQTGNPTCGGCGGCGGCGCFRLGVALFCPDTNARSMLVNARTHLHYPSQKQWLPGMRGKQEPPHRARFGAPTCSHPHG